MADYIDREEAAKAFSELLLSPYADGKAGGFSAGARDALKLARDMMLDKVPDTLSIPSADVVEAVRCKDCRYRYSEYEACTHYHDDDFCSRGERKE